MLCLFSDVSDLRYGLCLALFVFVFLILYDLYYDCVWCSALALCVCV